MVKWQKAAGSGLVSAAEYSGRGMASVVPRFSARTCINHASLVSQVVLTRFVSFFVFFAYSHLVQPA